MKLTGPRRIILIVWLVVVVALCLFVPWGYPATYGRCVAVGYAPLWTSGPRDHRTVVDTGRLLIELIAVTAAAGLALLLTSTRRDQNAPLR